MLDSAPPFLLLEAPPSREREFSSALCAVRYAGLPHGRRKGGREAGSHTVLLLRAR